jgi:bisphosphoglycerate-dependent phosphoglycerate mutase
MSRELLLLRHGKSDWEESYRSREWVSPEQAMKRVRQAELKPLIEKLARQMKTQEP